MCACIGSLGFVKYMADEVLDSCAGLNNQSRPISVSRNHVVWRYKINQHMLAQCPIRQQRILLTSKCLDALGLFSVFSVSEKFTGQIERLIQQFRTIFFTLQFIDDARHPITFIKI